MPFAATAHGKLYYEETGAGTPIIFAHELAADYRTWEAQVRCFSRSHRCITFNAPGYPPSDTPESPAAYLWTQQRDNIGVLMDHLGLASAHLVGLSMGAYSVLQFALAYPDRVTALGFSSGGLGSLPRGQASDPSPMLQLADLLATSGWDAAETLMTRGPSRLPLLHKDPRGWAEYRAYLLEHSIEGTVNTLRHFQATRPSLYDYEDDLRRLPTPVLLMAGDEDSGLIEVNLFLKRTLPRAGLWVAPNTGHGMNLEDPAAYNDMLSDFFQAVERGRWPPRAPDAQ